MNEKRFPWGALFLIFLFSFTFTINKESSRIDYNGIATGVSILSIITIVCVFKITDQIQDILLNRKIMKRRVRSRFEKLILFVIFVPAIGYSDYGDRIKGMRGKDVFSWEFHWGQSEFHAWGILCFLLFLFLHRIMLILKEVERTALVSDESTTP